MNSLINVALAAPTPSLTIASPCAWRTGRHIGLTLLKLYGLWLAICVLGRLTLFIWQHSRLSDISAATQSMAFMHGWRMDTIMLCYLLAPTVLLITLWPGLLQRSAAWLLRGWLLLVLLLLMFVEIASFPFFVQYDVRPNILFVEYLKYPHEVAAMLWKDQKVALLVATLALSVTTYAFIKVSAFTNMSALLRSTWWTRAIWCLPILALVFCGIRSTTGRRAANTSDALYSSNRVANEIAKNALYNVSFDIARGRKDSVRGAPKYGAMQMDAAYSSVFNLLGRTPADPLRPFLTTIKTAFPAARARNLVIIVEESMGAQFVGFAGAEHSLTPSLDRLAQQGIAFTSLYSNGTRSIRGLSAMTSGFLPLLGEGVIKRPKSQQDFFTLASLLKPLGYDASFIYGGAARFDDMKTWYLGNGFDTVIEEKDYDQPSFVGTWGVSDEDLLRKAHERFTTLEADNKPFVSVVFTSSNHTPFEFPNDKITNEPDVPKQSVNNAIKYADYAVGRFFEQARTSKYYANTVFVIVADHNVRVYGDDVIPIAGFHIPGLILLAGVPHTTYQDVASQPDLLATAISMLGVDLQAPVLGTSIFQKDRNGFVLMQFNDTYGFRRGNEVAVFQPNQRVATYRVERERLFAAPDNAQLTRDGLALMYVTEDLYENRLFGTGLSH